MRRRRRSKEGTTSGALIALAVAALVAGAAAARPGPGLATTSEVHPETLARALTIRAEVDARYRLVPGHGLAVTEAATTSVIESFTLLTPDLLEARVVSADNGLYFAICPLRATCPYPVRP